jgi:ribosomal peptide maturation radical SAM protein 1
MPRVLLVNMPLANLRWPNLGLGLLKAGLARRGIGCDVAYLNFDLAEMLGREHYDWIADHFAFVLGGERLFARRYFASESGAARRPGPPILPSDDAYWRDVLLPADAGLTAADRRDFEQAGELVGPFLDRCLAACDWRQYAIVGFTASFQQTMASLCIARRLKQLRPDVTVVFGGAACEGAMGVELLRQFPQIDYVFLGEADESFPRFAEQLLAGTTPMAERAGFVGRGTIVPAAVEEDACCGAPRPVDLDALPDPDFDDYFARLRRSPLAGGIEPLLYFETSRGCWWGQKHHCAFCGLNGRRLAFRSKSPERAIAELRRLVARYGIHRAASADNNLDPRYFQTLLPQLAAADFRLGFEYEMKTNLDREQVELLVRAGLGAAQLGVETFSTPILKLLNKGATALQNVQALKWFTAAGIEVKWNFLYGIPHEPPEEYAAMADLLPSLAHLVPPIAVGRVRMDRFAPYYERPEAFGLSNCRPHRAFAHIYPFLPDVLARLAYYFEFDFADGRNPLSYAAPLLAAIEQWQESHGTATLRAFDRSDGVLILSDTRPAAAEFQTRLTGLERQVYLFCDRGRKLSEIVAFAAAAGATPLHSAEVSLRQMLDAWVAKRLTTFLDGRYLSLALPAPA